MMQTPRTFVLVHGAWHGGWCWSRVANILRAAGHRVFTPTLTGLGERSHLFSGAINLTTHVDDIANVLAWEDLTNVVLCGHSYAGFVISGVVERVPERIGALVFLDAFVPQDGEAMLDVSPALRDRLTSRAGDFGGVAIPPIRAQHFGVNEADRAWVDGKCVPQPVASFLEKVRLTGARERVAARAYVRAAGYPSESFDLAREWCAGQPGWDLHDLPCGHDAMVDLPGPLAEILARYG